MRITSNTASDHLLAQLEKLGTRQAALQKQASTGMRVQSMEDDPAAVGEALGIQAEAAQNSQYLDNISRQQEKATATHNTLRDLKKVLDRAQEIAVLADDLKSPEQLQDYAAEIGQLIDHAAAMANTRHGGQYLFSGTSLNKPFEIVRSASGDLSEVRYAGSEITNQVEISRGVAVSSSIPGANTTGTAERGLFVDSRSGADLFGNLIRLQKRLSEGNTAAIATEDRVALSNDETNFIHHITANSALHARLEAASSSLKTKGTELKTQLSARIDADLAETMVNFSQTQTAYQVALQSAGRVMASMSLMDFLR